MTSRLAIQGLPAKAWKVDAVPETPSGSSVISPRRPEPPVALVSRMEGAGMVTVAVEVAGPPALMAVNV